MVDPVPLPPAFGVTPLPGTTVSGRTLVGGVPVRRAELAPGRAAVVGALLSGLTVAAASARTGVDVTTVGAVARRLVDTGIAGPVPARDAARSSRADVAAVIPARDAAGTIGAAIHGLRGVAEVVVVDDASRDRTADVAAAAGARVLRNDRPTGPAAARNRGIAETSADLVVVLDSDAVPVEGWLEALLAQLDDPVAGGAAPRVVSIDDGSVLGGYEADAGPLDLGGFPAMVRADGLVPFVSTTALLLRRSLWLRLGGFAEELRFGEDLDFAWRAAAAGRPLVHQPAALVRHHPRSDLVAHLRNRRRYGAAAGALSRRHDDHPRAAVAAPVLSAAAVAAVGGLPRTAAALTVAQVAVTAARVRALGTPPAEAAAEALRATARGGRGLAAAVSRPWLPVAIAVVMLRPRSRPAVVAAIVGRLARNRARGVDPATARKWLALRFLDDLAMSVGVIQGCATARTIRPLAPRPPDGPRRATTVLGTELELP